MHWKLGSAVPSSPTTAASYAGRARAAAGLCVCERRAAAAGWQVPAEPTMPRLNLPVVCRPLEVPPQGRSADSTQRAPT